MYTAPVISVVDKGFYIHKLYIASDKEVDRKSGLLESNSDPITEPFPQNISILIVYLTKNRIIFCFERTISYRKA